MLRTWSFAYLRELPAGSFAGWRKGGKKSKVVFAGFGISAVYKFVTDGLKLFPSEVDFGVRGLLGKGNVYRTNAGLDVLPALQG